MPALWGAPCWPWRNPCRKQTAPVARAIVRDRSKAWGHKTGERSTWMNLYGARRSDRRRGDWDHDEPAVRTQAFYTTLHSVMVTRFRGTCADGLVPIAVYPSRHLALSWQRSAERGRVSLF